MSEQARKDKRALCQAEEEEKEKRMKRDMNESHPYQVNTWLPGTGNPRSIYEHGHWVEMCRCATKSRAEEIAHMLSRVSHQDGVQVAKLVDDSRSARRFVAYLYLPESAKSLA